MLHHMLLSYMFGKLAVNIAMDFGWRLSASASARQCWNSRVRCSTKVISSLSAASNTGWSLLLPVGDAMYFTPDLAARYTLSTNGNYTPHPRSARHTLFTLNKLA